MLNELEMRKPEFQDGYPVQLADGQTWFIPRPRICFYPTVVDGKIAIGGGPTFGPEFDGMLDILFGVNDVEPQEYLRAEFEMTVRLLQANYNLTVEQIAPLITMELGNPASEARWEAIREAIRGNAPKPTADTSDSPA